MGASLSANVAKNYVGNIIKTIESHITSHIVNTTQTVELNIEAEGDIVATGTSVDITSRTTLQSMAVFETSDTIMSEVKNSIDNTSKSIIKGLNLGQVSGPVASVEQISIDLKKHSQVFMTKCIANMDQRVNYKLKGRSITFTDNTFKLFQTSLINCIQHNVSQLQSFSSNIARIEQLTSSEAIGLSGMEIIGIIVALVVLVAMTASKTTPGGGSAATTGIIVAVIGGLVAVAVDVGVWYYYAYKTKPLNTKDEIIYFPVAPPECATVV